MQIAYYCLELKKAVLRVSLAETRLTVYRQLSYGLVALGFATITNLLENLGQFF